MKNQINLSEVNEMQSMFELAKIDLQMSFDYYFNEEFNFEGRKIDLVEKNIIMRKWFNAADPETHDFVKKLANMSLKNYSFSQLATDIRKGKSIYYVLGIN